MMKSYKYVALLFVFIGCSEADNPKQSKDIIELGIGSCIKTLDSGTAIHKTIYFNDSTEEKSYAVDNWANEFSLFADLNFNKISKNGDLVFDTTLDKRTNRYLIRGMRLENGPGFQNMFLVLDSNRQLLQLKATELKESYFNNTQIDFFWNSEGEYQYRKVEQKRFAKDTRIEVIADWKEGHKKQ